MPMYDYECEECEHIFEIFQNIGDEKLVSCPKCGMQSLYRLISVPNIQKDSSFKDQAGQKVWFPKDGRPYYDKSLGKTFNTPKEKVEYMNKNKLVMDGSSDPKKWPVESGSFRDKSYRRQMKMED